MTPITNVACVFGTYQRKALLEAAVESVRKNAGVPVTFVVVDGGSADGSREWLAAQPDVVLIGQRGPLTGAVRAFNLGFGYAVEHGFDAVLHFNDDAELMTPNAVATALAFFDDPTVGAVAFEFDLRPGSKFEPLHDKIYSNFGVVRVKAGVEAAKAQGDPAGHNWWDPAYYTYGADAQLGCWLWKLGWKIVAANGLCVHDKNHQDELRSLNKAADPHRPDSKLFWNRWQDPASIKPPGATIDWAGAGLHLGCGQKRLPAPWINVDAVATAAADVVGDAFQVVRGVPAGWLARAYSSHFVEHIHPDKLPELLQLVHQALAPGGKFTIATIDLRGIYENRFQSSVNGSAWNSAIYGETNSGDHPGAAHRQCFTYDTLRDLVCAAGFAARPWSLSEYPEFDALNDYAKSCAPVTCFVEGTK